MRDGTPAKDLENKAKDQNNLKEAFKLFDTDGSGFLTADEFLAVLTRPGDNAMTLDMAKSTLDMFDENKDGKLDINEFCMAMRVFASQYDEDSSEFVISKLEEAMTDSMLDGCAAGFHAQIGVIAKTLPDQEAQVKYVEATIEAFREATVSGEDFEAQFQSRYNGEYQEVFGAAQIFFSGVNQLAQQLIESEIEPEQAMAGVMRVVDAFKEACHEAGPDEEAFLKAWKVKSRIKA